MSTASLPRGRLADPGVPVAIRTSRGVEAAAAFAIFLPLMFVGQITSAAPALSFGFTLIYVWIRRRELAGVLRQNWLLLLIPAYALVSVIWSGYPGITAKHSFELMLTILGGLMLSASRHPASVLTGAAAAFALFLGVSFAYGHSVGVGTMGLSDQELRAFSGLNAGKNLLAMTAAMGLLSALFVFCRSVRRLWLISAAVSGAALAMEAYLVVAARSAGASIAVVLAVAAFAVMSALGALGPRARAFVTALLVACLAAAGLVAEAFAHAITSDALQIFHKDPTLTGRAYLWYRSRDIIAQHPWLGRGFEAFWVHGNMDAEGLWQYAGITNRGGFNFHNTLIELMVTFGWVGTCFITAVFLVACAALLRRCIREPSLVSGAYIAFAVFQISRMPFESLTPSPVDLGTLLIFIVLGYGFAQGEPRRMSVASAGSGAALALRFRRPALAHRPRLQG
ncbi:MAG TPA: O-antigen ligase family protein [Caulobacteraceae bacterium]|nr:O-antigen ligase family protein [Caulobacteraceae bacterium]